VLLVLFSSKIKTSKHVLVLVFEKNQKPSQGVLDGVGEGGNSKFEFPFFLIVSKCKTVTAVRLKLHHPARIFVVVDPTCFLFAKLSPSFKSSLA
jgi:hypothetical protein